MNKKKLSSPKLITLAIVALIVLVLALSPASASQMNSLLAPEGKSNDSKLEVGVEWVNDYNQWYLGDLNNCGADAQGLYTWAGYAGAQKNFNWGNTSAWEQDFKGRWKWGGGDEDNWMDQADLIYFSGHGDLSGFYFGKGGENYDDVRLSWLDCQGDWGTIDADWLALSACMTLAVPQFSYGCLNGLRLILGSQTVMDDSPNVGWWFGRYLYYSHNMQSAWRNAYIITQPKGRVARFVAENSSYLYDTLRGNHNSYTAVDLWKTYTTYTNYMAKRVEATKYLPNLRIDYDMVNGEMPIYEAPPLTLDEANTRWDSLGTIFNLPPEVMSATKAPNVGSIDDIRFSTGAELAMDDVSGSYNYVDPTRLWNVPITSLFKPEKLLFLQPEDATTVAEQFLRNNGLMPSGARYVETGIHGLVEDTGQAACPLCLPQATTDVYEVAFTRYVTYTLSALSGSNLASNVLEFEVVGPGAKLLAYVSPAVLSSTPTETVAEEAVIGVMGGFHQITEPTKTPDAPQATVPIMTYDQAVQIFYALEPMMSLGYTPIVAQSRDVLTYTLSYYEHSLGVSQDQLIPVYSLQVNYTITGTETMLGDVYIPAAAEYLPPYAGITTTLPADQMVLFGDSVTFYAQDASKTLANLGFDPLLNFVAGTGIPSSYLYNWYLGSVADENKIGSGKILNYIIGAGGERPGPVSIILEVIDSLSPREPNKSYATYILNTGIPIFLPTIRR